MKLANKKAEPCLYDHTLTPYNNMNKKKQRKQIKQNEFSLSVVLYIVQQKPNANSIANFVRFILVFFHKYRYTFIHIFTLVNPNDVRESETIYENKCESRGINCF